MSELVTKLVNLNHMPQDPIWQRLGYRSQHSDPEARGLYTPLIKKYLADTWVRIFYVERPVQVMADGLRLGDYALSSRLVLERFQQAEAALIMGASVRPEDEAQLRRLQEQHSLQEAVILDAVLSEKVDFALDFIEQEAAVGWRRSGRTGGRRLSCGYGDFSLAHQAFFHRILEFAKYGIRLNAAFVLEPEKSATALLPIYSGAKAS